jgi:hypothetical protein
MTQREAGERAGVRGAQGPGVPYPHHAVGANLGFAQALWTTATSGGSAATILVESGRPPANLHIS